MKPDILTKHWRASLGVIGTIVAFALTNYWSYTAGKTSGNSLLIDTMARYRAFYDEVRLAPELACTADHKLQGLYLSQYKAMLPVIKGEIKAPYDNPCPILATPAAPEGLTISVCKTWPTWRDFLADPNPTMSINISEYGAIEYPLDAAWIRSLTQFRQEVERVGTQNCFKGIPCPLRYSFSQQLDH